MANGSVVNGTLALGGPTDRDGATVIDRVSLSDWVHLKLATAVGSCMLLALYYTTQPLYARLASKLVDLENCRTESQADGSLAFKLISYDLIAYYSTLFFVAFVKPSEHTRDYCHDPLDYRRTEQHIKAAHAGLNPYCMTELSQVGAYYELPSIIVSHRAPPLLAYVH